MTIGLLWLALIVLIPLIGFYFFGINAAPVFLSLCLGYVLVMFDSKNASNVASSINHNVPVHINASLVAINLILLLGPAVLTIISQVRSISGHKKFLNLLSSASVGLFGALIIVPRLPSSVSSSIMSNSYWLQIVKYKTAIVGIGGLIAIVFFLFSLKKKATKKHHEHK